MHKMRDMRRIPRFAGWLCGVGIFLGLGNWELAVSQVEVLTTAGQHEKGKALAITHDSLKLEPDFNQPLMSLLGVIITSGVQEIKGKYTVFFWDGCQFPADSWSIEGKFVTVGDRKVPLECVRWITAADFASLLPNRTFETAPEEKPFSLFTKQGTAVERFKADDIKAVRGGDKIEVTLAGDKRENVELANFAGVAVSALEPPAPAPQGIYASISSGGYKVTGILKDGNEATLNVFSSCVGLVKVPVSGTTTIYFNKYPSTFRGYICCTSARIVCILRDGKKIFSRDASELGVYNPFGCVLTASGLLAIGYAYSGWYYLAIVNPLTGEVIGNHSHQGGGTNSILAADNGNILIVSPSGIAEISDNGDNVKTLAVPPWLANKGGGALLSAKAGDGSSLVVGSGNIVALWDYRQSKELARFYTGNLNIQGVSAGADGGLYFSSSNTIYRATKEGTPEKIFQHAQTVTDFELLPDGRIILQDDKCAVVEVMPDRTTKKTICTLQERAISVTRY